MQMRYNIVRYVLMLFQAIFVFEPAICGCV